MAFDDPFAFGAVNAESRHGDAAAVNQAGHACDADQPAPRPRANNRAEASLLEIERKAVATRTTPAIDEHRFRACMSDFRPRPVHTIAHAPVINDFAAEHFDKAVRNLAAA